MTKQLPEDKSRILVVEGPGDHYFFCKFLEHLGWRDKFHFINCEGKDNLAKELANILNDDNFARLTNVGIIRDNDYPDNRNGKSAFAAILEAINTANKSFIINNPNIGRQLSKPQQPRELTENIPHVSVLLLPSDDGDGAVEDLVFAALCQDSILDCVDAYFACLESVGLKANQARISKSKLSVYVSGKVIDEKYAKHDDAKRQFLTQAVDMKWWQEEDIWEREAFHKAKDFLTQLLAG